MPFTARQNRIQQLRRAAGFGCLSHSRPGLNSIRVTVKTVARSRPPCAEEPHSRFHRSLTLSTARLAKRVSYKQTPSVVPSVFVMTSVIPELRVGRKACRISIVKLVANPIAIVPTLGWRTDCIDASQAAKQNPRGTKPTMLTRKSSQ